MKDNFYLAHKYAVAFDFCANNAQEAMANFSSYHNALERLARVKDIVENPAIAFNQKETFLREFLGKDIGASFVMLLVKAKRQHLAKVIERELMLLLDKRNKINRAQVTTAHALNSQEKQQAQKTLSEYFKTPLTLSFKEDKNILGGIIVKKDDVCIDGSILGQLKNLEQELKR
jgi:ATP synthase, F1 delta subunit